METAESNKALRWGWGGILSLVLFKKPWNWTLVVRWSVGILIALILVFGFYFGTQEGSRLQTFYGLKADKGVSLDVGTQLLIESVKWGLGFLGLIAIGLYNLYRADKKDKVTRTADLVYKYTDARIATALTVSYQFEELTQEIIKYFATDDLEEADEKREFIQNRYFMLPSQCEPFGLLPSRCPLPHVLLSSYCAKIFYDIYEELGHHGNARKDFTRKDEADAIHDKISDSLADTLVFLHVLIREERHRQFICNTKPREEWPQYVLDDLDFMDDENQWEDWVNQGQAEE